jgi:hypothetical protein
MTCVGVFIELFIPEHKFFDRGTLRENLENHTEGVKRVTNEALEKTNTVFLEKTDSSIESEFHKVAHNSMTGYWIRIVGYCDNVVARNDKGWFVGLMIKHFNMLCENIHLYHVGGRTSEVMQ